jgi:hypothetical protein
MDLPAVIASRGVAAGGIPESEMPLGYRVDKQPTWHPISSRRSSASTSGASFFSGKSTSCGCARPQARESAGLRAARAEKLDDTRLTCAHLP